MNQDSSPAKARLRERLRGATATAILEAGEAVFAEQGLAARMDAIAERAGVAVGTLYNYFGDRDALVSALIDSRRAELFQKLDEVLSSTESWPFRRQLETFVDTIFRHMNSHRRFLGILLEAELADLVHANKKQAAYALLDRCEQIVVRGVQSGALRSETSIDYAFMLHGMVRAAFTAPLMLGKPIHSNPEQAEALVDFFLCGAGKVSCIPR